MEFESFVLSAKGNTKKLEQIALHEKLLHPLGFSSFIVGEVIECLQEMVCWRQELDLLTNFIISGDIQYESQPIPVNTIGIIHDLAECLVKQIKQFELVDDEQRLPFFYHAIPDGKFSDVILKRYYPSALPPGESL